MLNDRLTTAPVDGVLYLHGFNSGSASPKAQLMRAVCQGLRHGAGSLACRTPQLSHRPDAALARAEAELADLGDNVLLVGSSMGGFLASVLAERHDLPAVVINPAVAPARLVEAWWGQAFVNPYNGERFTVEAAHREALAAMTPAYLTPERYLLLLGTADETLDCRDAFRAYRGCRMLIEPGGDHGFSHLAAYLPAVLAHGGHTFAGPLDAPSAP
ncbi:esterase [Modicisalibacter tunisiensis]|uniref:YqiA/YcfP family alpha/beta fold hydrolase n=1 Tax=Modicisalibacter tunisiensis TaxID=390637 RepID=UPI001CCF6DE8|nr:YqiA/YcfP family alpha/beta fold hydrolase [Modicisalibacter tunisiensis]MBZ9538677.1 esterase [Modicisalibacter tunisiensis]